MVLNAKSVTTKHQKKCLTDLSHQLFLQKSVKQTLRTACENLTLWFAECSSLSNDALAY